MGSLELLEEDTTKEAYDSKSKEKEELLLEQMLICEKCGEPIFGASPSHKCGDFEKLLSKYEDLASRHEKAYGRKLATLRNIKKEADEYNAKPENKNKFIIIPEEDLEIVQEIKEQVEEEQIKDIIVEIDKKSGAITIRSKNKEAEKELVDKLKNSGLDVEIIET